MIIIIGVDEVRRQQHQVKATPDLKAFDGAVDAGDARPDPRQHVERCIDCCDLEAQVGESMGQAARARSQVQDGTMRRHERGKERRLWRLHQQGVQLDGAAVRRDLARSRTIRPHVTKVTVTTAHA